MGCGRVMGVCAGFDTECLLAGMCIQKGVGGAYRDFSPSA